MLYGFVLAALQAAPAPIVAPPVVTVVTRKGLSDEEACKFLTATTGAIMRELPKMVDVVTRLDGYSTICALKSVAANKFVSLPMDEMRVGWRGRKQSQWNEIVCNNEAFGPLARRGWRFSQNLTFVSGERVTLDAHCEGASARKPQD